MKIGIIADIHGNAPALAAVLDDLSRENPDVIIQLGDAFNGPIDPAGVARLLRSQSMLHITGNGEGMVLTEVEAQRSPSARFARARLSEEDLQWVKTWPSRYHHEVFTAFHGSPRSDTDYLLEEVTDAGVRLAQRSKIEPQLSEISTPLIFCGHSHLPQLVEVSGSRLVINPGSVGLPAYRHTVPVAHCMEVGSPLARYAVAERFFSGWRIRHVALPYDYERAAMVAEREGFSGWAHALRRGYAQ